MIAATSRVEHDTLLNLFDAQITSELNTRAIAIVRQLIQYPESFEKELLNSLKIDSLGNSKIHSIYAYVRSLFLESLLLNINIERPNDHSSSFRNKLLASKKILQSQILIGKGLFEEASVLAEESNSKSSKYHHYGITQEALELKMLMSAKDKSIRTVRNQLNQSKSARKQRIAIGKIQYEFVNAAIETNDSAGNQADILNRAIQKSTKINDNYPAPLGQYFILLLREKLAMLNSSFASSQTLLLETLNLIKTKPSIYSNAREVDIVLKLSITYAHLKKFSDAKRVLKAIKSNIKKNNVEAYLTSKRLVLLSLYNQENASAIKQIKSLQKSKYTLRQPYASSRFQFLKAIHALYTNEIKTCCNIVLEELKLSFKSSNDLLLGNLMALSLASYELPASENQFKSSINTLARESLNRLNTETLNERESIILGVTRTIFEQSKTKFKFNEYFSSQLNALQITPQSEHWKPYGFEVFPFDNWLKAQIEGTKCDFKMA